MVILSILGVIGRFPFTNSPFVNLEYFYSQSSEIIVSGDGLQASLRHLSRAFNNPLGSVLTIALAQGWFGVAEWSSRLPSILGWFVGVSVVYLVARTLWSPFVGALGAMIMGISPLYWVYGGLAYPDVQFTALITLAMLVAGAATFKRTIYWHIIAAVLLVLATLVRYNGLLFVPVIMAIVFAAEKKGGINNAGTSSVIDVTKIWFLYIVVGAVTLIPYLLWVKSVSGNILVPGLVHVTASDMRFHMVAFIPRLGAYVMWLGALSGPLAFFALRDMLTRVPLIKLKKTACLVIAIDLVVVSLVHYMQTNHIQLFGEMHFGWLERLLPLWPVLILQFVLLIAGEIVLAALILWGRERLWPNGYVLLWVIMPLLAHALYRGAQRYTIFLLPPLAMYLAWVASTALQTVRWRSLAMGLVSAHVLLSMSLGILTSIYYAAEGYAAADVARHINDNHLDGIERSLHNPVLVNSGYLVHESLFAPSGITPSYRTVALGRTGDVDNVVYMREVKLLGILIKRYVIVEY